ncbi:pyrroline-5-carboxylate reductase [Pseudidiomarina mangrovi]|uniref:pyrroline-5-carboxylate reductase n=1 Tax=Pseudidiomarina mangrovi TaxID=2487133 RepID=UPI000FCB68A0|nr:pyrroline-5-carboxylate reductase [Pseudidiomarina mangrovi]
MTAQPRNIAFIGAGNMTQSIVGGMVQNGYPANYITVSNPSMGKLEHLQQQCGVSITQDNNQAVANAEVVVLAVKPQLMAAVCEQLKQSVTNLGDKLIISIAAGIRLAKYQQYLAADRIIRVMPNTPSLVGQGMTGLVTQAATSAADREFASSIFDRVGKTLWVDDEDQMDILSALAGSGPAYFFEFMASLQKAAVALGFNHQQARILVNQTALGAATMATDSELELPDLRAQVTSKGGSTAKGIEVYQAADVDFISEQALRAAVKRNQEMAQLF